MRKFTFLFICLASLAGTLYVFRAPLAMRAFQSTLANALPSHKLSCESAHFDWGRLVIRKLQIAKEGVIFGAEEAEVTFEFQLKQLHLMAHAQLHRPEIKLEAMLPFSLEAFTRFFTPSKHFSLSTEAKVGKVQMGKEQYAFYLQSSSSKTPEGVFAIAQDPNLLSCPFLTARWGEDQGEILFRLQVDPIEVSSAKNLITYALMHQLPDWEPLKGILEVSGSARLSKSGKLENYSGEFSCEQLELVRGACQVSAQHARGTLKETLGFTLEASGAELLFNERTFAQEIALERLPGREAKWTIQGNFDSLGPFVLEGIEKKGGGEASCHFSEVETAITMSISPFQPRGYLISLGGHKWHPSQAQAFIKQLALDFPFFKQIALLRGELNSKVTLVIEDSKLSSLDIEELSAENAYFTFMEESVDAASFRADGRFHSLREGEINVGMQGSLVSAPAFLSEPLQLALSCKVKKESYEVSGEAKFGAEGIQFGFESVSLIPKEVEEISEGWVRAESLSSRFYHPLIANFFQDANVEAVIDLFGAFDGEKLELSLQSDKVLFRHPWAGLKVEGMGEKDPALLRTSGRATLIYYPLAHIFDLQIPLKNAILYQYKTELLFDQITGMLAIHHDPQSHFFSLTSSGANVQLKSQTLLTKVKSKLKGDFKTGALVFEEFCSNIPLPMKGEYCLTAPLLKKEGVEWEAEAFLFDQQKTPLAQLHAKGQETLLAEISLNQGLPFSGEVTLAAQFDPEGTTIECKSDALMRGNQSLGATSLRIKNQGNQWRVESLKIGSNHLKGAFSARDGGIYVSEFEAALDQAAVQGVGMLFIDFPSEQQEFTLRSEALFDIAFQHPLPLQIHTEHPVKIAYTPSMGVAFSNLDLAVEKSKMKIECLEGNLEKQRWHAHKCQYLLEEELLDHLLTHSQLPEFAYLLLFPKEMEGAFHLDWENGALKIDGAQQTKYYHFTGGNQKWLLSFEESTDLCQLSGSIKENQVTLDQIKGTLCGQELDLISSDDNALLGKTKLNFHTLDSLISVPTFFQGANLGEGFELEGKFSALPDQTLHFTGKWKGSSFEAFGYHLSNFEAIATLSREQLLLEDCLLIDSAGRCSAEKIVISNERFEIPKIEIENFQPSFLRSLNPLESPSMPLIVRAAFIEGLRGILGKPETFEGRGSLRFSGALEPAELPKGIAKKWEPSLFTPVSGDADYEFKEGRCYLTSLRNCHSAHNRSIFHLSGKERYFDFEGNLFIDLQLQANIGRPLYLELRGTKDHPELNLR